MMVSLSFCVLYFVSVGLESTVSGFVCDTYAAYIKSWRGFILRKWTYAGQFLHDIDWYNEKIDDT